MLLLEFSPCGRVRLRRYNIRCRRLSVWFWSCSRAVEAGTRVIEEVPALRIQDVLQGFGQLVIASDSSNQHAFEPCRYSDGIFTMSFIERLRKPSDLKAAFDYIETEVRSEALAHFGPRQTPILKDADCCSPSLSITVPRTRPHRTASVDGAVISPRFCYGARFTHASVAGPLSSGRRISQALEPPCTDICFTLL